MPNNDDFDIIKMRSNDVYSSSNRDISSKSYDDISSSTTNRQGQRTSSQYHSPQYSRAQQPSHNQRLQQQQRTQQQRAAAAKRKRKKKHTLIKVIAFAICVILVFSGCFYAYAYSVISKIKRDPLDTNNLGISTSDYSSVKNIALLGIDSREDNNTGRSDAIVILTVDKKHKKLKMTSIARDTYASVDGHSKDKLTHAYAYGKSQLAVKTLNQNFNLEITDYVTVNFFEFARIIDYVGGVTVDVDEAEMNEMNTNIIPWLVVMGIPCELITTPGTQLLSGGQAVCYARIRHTDNDIQRGNRQKEVLTSMFDQVKKINPLKLPKLASMIVNECETSMATNDIMSLGMWAVLLSPKFEQLSIPNENVPSSGKTIGGVWYYVYDLIAAQKEIKDFIFEENYYAPEAVAERIAKENAASSQ